MGYISQYSLNLEKIKDLLQLYEEFYNLVVNEKANLDAQLTKNLMEKINSFYS